MTRCVTMTQILQDLNATLHTIFRSFGDVHPTADLVRLLS